MLGPWITASPFTANEMQKSSSLLVRTGATQYETPRVNVRNTLCCSRGRGPRTARRAVTADREIRYRLGVGSDAAGWEVGHEHCDAAPRRADHWMVKTRESTPGSSDTQLGHVDISRAPLFSVRYSEVEHDTM